MRAPRWTVREYLKRVKSSIKTPTKEMEGQLSEFCDLCSYVAGQYDQDDFRL